MKAIHHQTKLPPARLALFSTLGLGTLKNSIGRLLLRIPVGASNSPTDTRNGGLDQSRAYAILLLSLGTSWHRFGSVFELEYRMVAPRSQGILVSDFFFVDNGSGLRSKSWGLLSSAPSIKADQGGQLFFYVTVGIAVLYGNCRFIQEING